MLRAYYTKTDSLFCALTWYGCVCVCFFNELSNKISFCKHFNQILESNCLFQFCFCHFLKLSSSLKIETSVRREHTIAAVGQNGSTFNNVEKHIFLLDNWLLIINEFAFIFVIRSFVFCWTSSNVSNNAKEVCLTRHFSF